MSTSLSSASARALVAAAVLSSAAAAAQQPGDGYAIPLRWYAAADPATGQTLFSVEFDEPLDMPGAHALQFWLADSGNPVGRVYEVVYGQRTFTTERVIEFQRSVAQGLADIVEIRPLDWTPANGELASVGGWGQIVSSVPFTVTEQSFQMSVPISVTGESFVYELMVVRDGAETAVVDGISGVVGIAPVPEPATLTSMLVGLGVIGALAAFRRRDLLQGPRACSRRLRKAAIPGKAY